MLDETTCPVCGKDLRDDFHQAVAHYLAHLVQQNQPPSFEEKRAAATAELIAHEYIDTSNEETMERLRREGIIRPL